MDEKQIRELFQTHGVELSKSDVWAVQGTPVIKHNALERLSAHIGITFDMPIVLRAERDEAVFLVRGTRKDGISDWSTGEAMVAREGQPGGNYKVSGKQASYTYAMAEKRARDRVIIKLAKLHGAYSEDEADDFKRGVQQQESSEEPTMSDLLEARSEILRRASFQGTNALKKAWEETDVALKPALKMMVDKDLKPIAKKQDDIASARSA